MTGVLYFETVNNNLYILKNKSYDSTIQECN
jgi:hypothetical protein